MSIRSVPAGAALLLFSAASASAGPVPWSYRSPANETAFPPGATGGVTFPNTGFVQAAGDAEAVVARVLTWSVAREDAPDRAADLPYRFAVELRDGPSGEAATLSFDGALSGTYWRDGADLRNRFTGPVGRSVELGDRLYTMTLTGFDAPAGSGDELGGAITARVTVGEVDWTTGPPPVVGPPAGGPAATPEPASLLLAVVGMGAGAVARSAMGRAGKGSRGGGPGTRSGPTPGRLSRAAGSGRPGGGGL